MITLIFAALATYRLALLITQEEGPFEVGTWVRNRFVRQDWLGRGIRCILCTSFWISLPISLFMFQETRYGFWVMNWLATAGLVTLTWQWTHK